MRSRFRCRVIAPPRARFAAAARTSRNTSSSVLAAVALQAAARGVFIGSVLLWDILFRGQLGFSISFLEEMYARNLGNIMMSPLRPVEFLPR